MLTNGPGAIEYGGVAQPGPVPATALSFTEIRRGPRSDRYTWAPFKRSPQFTAGWWHVPPYLAQDPRFLSVRLTGREVARVELVTAGVGSVRTDSQGPGGAVRIRFIEVALSRRRQGIGRDIVRALAAAYPEQHLSAIGAAADPFWTSLGWQQLDPTADHPTGALALFTQPARPHP